MRDYISDQYRVAGLVVFLSVLVVGFWFRREDRDYGVELSEKLVARMPAEDFVEPAWVGLCIFLCKYFYDVTLLKFSLEVDHFAIDDSTSALSANLAMEAIGEV